ncbi:hypothetical protein C8Q75DRAFT_805263 [Abortiporus biennis]|nr:hypothetical protein C8Q75DRAFT_805263 [Abortiporus biennis]
MNTNPLPTDSGLVKTKPAPAPWDLSSKADAILRTTDKVDFRIRKAILAAASDVFDGMFSLPEIPENRKRKEPENDEYVDDIPVIPVEEGSDTVEIILRYCYPIPKPNHFEPQALCDALAASRKYLMEYVEGELLKQFKLDAEQNPFLFYIIASKFVWDTETVFAAKACLLEEFDPPYLSPIMDEFPASILSRLLLFRQSSIAAALKAVGFDEQRKVGPPMVKTYTFG